MSRGRVTLIVGVLVVFASMFPFIYRAILPLLTYAGLIVVPIGGIVFAEQHILPRMGCKSNWHALSGAKDNMPALVSWGVSLVFGFGLDFLNVIPFVYLFLPTWFVSIIVYVVMAKRAGADASHPEAERREAEFARAVAKYQDEMAAREPVEHVKDTSTLTRIIRAVWIVIGLVVPAVLAWRVLFNSPDLYTYFVNRELFYDVTIWCTLIYFVFAWWDLQRGKSFDRMRRVIEATMSPAE